MCSIATRQLIENSVQDFVGDRKAFTAYDVTKDIRAKGTGVSERHNELKKEVHQIFNDGQMGDYTRTAVKLPSAPTPAFLYHPPEINPDAYVAGIATPQTVVPVGQPTQGPIVATPVPDADEDEDGDEDKCVVTTQGNGFVRLPVSLVKSIGLAGGDDAAVFAQGTTIRVCSVSKAPLGIDMKVQKVDPRGNVRIYRKTLREAGVWGNPLNVRVSTSDLVISDY